jgi:hypothetical protein
LNRSPESAHECVESFPTTVGAKWVTTPTSEQLSQLVHDLDGHQARSSKVGGSTPSRRHRNAGRRLSCIGLRRMTSVFAFGRVVRRCRFSGFLSEPSHPLRTLPYARRRRARGPYAAVSRSSLRSRSGCMGHALCTVPYSAELQVTARWSRSHSGRRQVERQSRDADGGTGRVPASIP